MERLLDRLPLAARQICPKSSLHRDFRRARKSFAALPCNRPVAAKHMLLCPPGLRHLDNFLYLEKPCPFISTLPSGQLHQNMTNPTRLSGLWQLHHTMTISARLPGLTHLDNILIPCQFLPICRDFDILTILPGRETVHTFTGINKNTNKWFLQFHQDKLSMTS